MAVRKKQIKWGRTLCWVLLWAICVVSVSAAQPTGLSTEPAVCPGREDGQDVTTDAPGKTVTGEAETQPADGENGGLFLEGEEINASADADGTQTLFVQESEAVGDDYFSDAAFVGDSRTEGLMLYSKLAGKGDFYCKRGLMASTALDATGYLGAKDQKSIRQALDAGNYKKVYLSLGINEMGWPDVKLVEEAYTALIDGLREILPDATLYIELLVPFCEEKLKEDTPSYFNNERVKLYNEAIVRVAKDKQVWLLKPADAILNEEGRLSPDQTGDGIHLLPDACVAWGEYLKTHTVKEGAAS